ncbi:MAG: biotin/lipoyl-binding protein [Candidatus Dadabacteria bacterium]|nr:MAG: biotin/lipoyl-binding protein [Candidatus Dadabacteria bacterium]
MKKYTVKINDREYPVTLIKRSGADFTLSVNDSVFTLSIAPDYSLSEHTQPDPAVTSPASATPVHTPSDLNSVTSPMPGIVVSVPVRPGDSVNQGDTVIVVEAMKMENNITAPKNGKIEEVRVKEGDEVNSGDILVKIS